MTVSTQVLDYIESITPDATIDSKTEGKAGVFPSVIMTDALTVLRKISQGPEVVRGFDPKRSRMRNWFDRICRALQKSFDTVETLNESFRAKGVQELRLTVVFAPDSGVPKLKHDTMLKRSNSAIKATAVKDAKSAASGGDASPKTVQLKSADVSEDVLETLSIDDVFKQHDRVLRARMFCRWVDYWRYDPTALTLHPGCEFLFPYDNTNTLVLAYGKQPELTGRYKHAFLEFDHKLGVFLRAFPNRPCLVDTIDGDLLITCAMSLVTSDPRWSVMANRTGNPEEMGDAHFVNATRPLVFGGSNSRRLVSVNHLVWQLSQRRIDVWLFVLMMCTGNTHDYLVKSELLSSKVGDRKFCETAVASIPHLCEAAGEEKDTKAQETPFAVLSSRLSVAKFQRETFPAPDDAVLSAYRSWLRSVLDRISNAAAKGMPSPGETRVQFARFWQAYSYWIECTTKNSPTIDQTTILSF